MASRIAARFAELNIEIPKTVAPVANYLLYSQVNNTIHLSGHLPKTADGFIALGTVGKDVSVEDAQKCAKQCLLNIFGTLNLALHGDLDRIVKFVKLNVFVSSTPDFTQQPIVANGASDFLCEIMGTERGRCARAAVGCSSLPLGVPVEIDAIVEVSEAGK